MYTVTKLKRKKFVREEEEEEIDFSSLQKISYSSRTAF